MPQGDVLGDGQAKGQDVLDRLCPAVLISSEADKVLSTIILKSPCVEQPEREIAERTPPFSRYWSLDLNIAMVMYPQ